MTLQILSVFLASRAVREWDVIVRDVVEEMDLVFGQHEPGGDGMNRCVAPTLVEKATVLIQRLEKVDVGLRTQPVQVADLKVGPLIIVSETLELQVSRGRTKWQWL